MRLRSAWNTNREAVQRRGCEEEAQLGKGRLCSGIQKPRMVTGIEILPKISPGKYKVLQKQTLLLPGNISE